MPLQGDYEPNAIDWVREQVELYERTGGTEGGTTRDGLPVVVVTMLGARSRKVRKVAVIRIEHEGAYALVASLGGSDKNPSWYHNIVAHPGIELQDGPTPVDMVAAEVHGEEKAAWWARCVAAFPAYADYQRATDRAIPVLVARRPGKTGGNGTCP